MTVYRLASRSYRPDSGEGARMYGGRWNHQGTAVIYAAASVPMAALEVIAHQGAIPITYEVVEITIPDDLAIEDSTNNELPDLAESAAYGTAWAESRRTAVLRVPAAVIRGEHNYVLNPLHPDFPRIRFRGLGPNPIDPRLRKARE